MQDIKFLRPNLFSLTVPKDFRGEPFRVSKKIVVMKVFMHRGEGASRFCLKNYVSQNQKISWAGPLCLRNVLVWRILWTRRRVSRFSVEILLFRCAKKFRGNHSVFLKNSGNEKFNA